MITHVVLLRLRAGLNTGSAAVQQIHRDLVALPSLISDIRGWRCGFNSMPDAQAADYVLVAEFDDVAALHRYFEHPAHLAVLTRLDGIADILFADLQAAGY